MRSASLLLFLSLLVGCPAPAPYCGPPEPGMKWCDVHTEITNDLGVSFEETWITCDGETHVAYQPIDD
mgnify:CR=1 FL=1